MQLQMQAYEDVHESRVEENGCEESVDLNVALDLVRVLHAEVLQDREGVRAQETLTIQRVTLGPGRDERRHVHQHVNHGDEEDERDYRERRTESKLQHVEETFSSGIHELLVLQSATQQRLALEGVVHAILTTTEHSIVTVLVIVRVVTILT